MRKKTKFSRRRRNSQNKNNKTGSNGNWRNVFLHSVSHSFTIHMLDRFVPWDLAHLQLGCVTWAVALGDRNTGSGTTLATDTVTQIEQSSFP